MTDTNQLPGAPHIQQLGWVYCYQGQEPAFSYAPQPSGIPKTHYWQVPVFDTEQVLALRPVQVPMTDDDVDAKCLTIIGHLLSRRERDRIVWRMAEAHHFGTAAQAKKEGA